MIEIVEEKVGFDDLPPKYRYMYLFKNMKSIGELKGELDLMVYNAMKRDYLENKIKREYGVLYFVLEAVDGKQFKMVEFL